MSPPLVVAMALKGNMNFDPTNDPIQNDVLLKDLWPSKDEIKSIIKEVMSPAMYKEIYAKVSEGTELWNSIEANEDALYAWDENNTYIQNPPYFEDFTKDTPAIEPIETARLLLSLGDSITTDHISPAGAIAKDSDAAKYLIENGVSQSEFNSYGSRRGNDRVMTRGTFANIRLSNLLAPGTSGPVTKYFNDGDNADKAQQTSVFQASTAYQTRNVPCIVIAGKLFGNGSSRDWAAKGQKLLGIKAVLAESFERIHRSNLIGMGILPVEIKSKIAKENGLDGSETYTIKGLSENIKPYMDVTLEVTKNDGTTIDLPASILLQTPIEVEYYRHGGILQYTLRQLLKKESDMGAAV
jgi:aconitate hydratase